MKPTFLLSFALLVSLVLQSQQADDIVGVWYNQEKTAKVEIFKQGEKYHGKVVWLKEPNRDGSPKVARQRYTIANPYSPGSAGKLLFSIKNYASGDQFFFPPYIQSIQNYIY